MPLFDAAPARRNWIAVACAEHARRGCASAQQGYMQVCHGKRAPLQRIAPGDRVAYYAPTVTMGGKDRCQRFVSIGLVQAGEPYAFRDAGPPQGAKAPMGGREDTPVPNVGARFSMGGGFVPFRRDVAYVRAQEASILPLLDQFAFVEDRARWGYKFRFGLFQIGDADMRLIASAMQADALSLYF